MGSGLLSGSSREAQATEERTGGGSLAGAVLGGSRRASNHRGLPGLVAVAGRWLGSGLQVTDVALELLVGVSLHAGQSVLVGEELVVQVASGLTHRLDASDLTLSRSGVLFRLRLEVGELLVPGLLRLLGGLTRCVSHVQLGLEIDVRGGQLFKAARHVGQFTVGDVTSQKLDPTVLVFVWHTLFPPLLVVRVEGLDLDRSQARSAREGKNVRLRRQVELSSLHASPERRPLLLSELKAWTIGVLGVPNVHRPPSIGSDLDAVELAATAGLPELHLDTASVGAERGPGPHQAALH